MSDYHELLTSAHVWYLDPRNPASAIPPTQALAMLSDEERSRYAQLAIEAVRHQFLVTRVLCRTTLSRYTGVDPAAWAFVRDDHGKPSIAGPVEFRGLHFNLTHTEGLIACAVTRIGEIGVDAEETSRPIDVEGIARHFLSDVDRAEIDRLPSSDRDKRLLEIWVLKEAYVKGRGIGLSQSPESFTIRSADDGHVLPLDGWQLSLHRPTPRHVAATAVRAETAVPVRWHRYE